MEKDNTLSPNIYGRSWKLVDELGKTIETFRLQATAQSWKLKLEKKYGKLKIKRA